MAPEEDKVVPVPESQFPKEESKLLAIDDTPPPAAATNPATAPEEDAMPQFPKKEPEETLKLLLAMNEKLDKLSTQFQVLQRVVLGRSNEVLGRVLRVEQDVVHVATSLGNAFADSLQVHVEMLGSMSAEFNLMMDSMEIERMGMFMRGDSDDSDLGL